MIRFKPEHPEAAATAREKLLGLVGRIEAIRSYEVGLNIVESARAWDLVIVATYDSLDGLKAYNDHPEHQAVGAYIREHMAQIAAVDYEL
jgi:hypothetical protein